MATGKELKDVLKGRGRIRATAQLKNIDAYILKKHGKRRALTPSEISVISNQASAQIRIIKRNWPVRTGTSRAGWTFRVQPNPGRVAVVFENMVYYSGWVTRKGQTPVREGGTPWYQKLVPKVWKAGLPRLERLLKAEIDRTEKELARGTEMREAGQQTRARRRTIPKREQNLLQRAIRELF